MAEMHSRSSMLDAGTLVGGIYEIRRVLGTGGMGVVYEAHDIGLNRRVAVKMSLSPTMPLKREGQALAAIRHPSMVGVYALGTHEGAEFLVMELVRGTTLWQRMRAQHASGKPFPIAEIVDILIGIADGLAAVHAAGVAHRDVKPANIMLAPGGRTVLMDFGLFKPEFERLDTVAGSPEYMAPEVCSGRVEAGMGHLVDLYALGVIAWELLFGAPPFRGADAMSTLTLHVHAPVPEMGDQRPDLPPELAALVLELLAKSPGNRPPSTDEVLGRLRAVRARGERTGWRRPLSVLIVDDDRELAETLRAVIREVAPDAEVALAPDGEAAYTGLLRRVPTLLVIDLNMPRMNGLELCMALRGSEIGDDCRIVIISGSELRPKDRELLRQLELADFVPKTPALPRAIARVVRELRHRPGMWRQ